VSEAEAPLEAGQRAVFAALGDVLIPAADGMPSASEADPAGRWLDRALAARPDLAPRLASVFAAAAGREPAAEVDRLRSSDPDGFAALATAVAGAYYMNIKVRKRIGYPGQAKNPPYPDEADYYLGDGALLAPVLQRGAFSPEPPSEPRPAFDAPRRRDSADVLIIGAGASGAVAAKRLAIAGFRVVCLEQGGWMNASDFPGDKLEFELVAEKQWSADPNVRAMPQDYPCEISGSDISPVMFNAVGGSTIHFGAQWARMRPADFRLRTLHGVGDDWPVTYEEMRPFYERLDEELLISGVGGDPAYPPGPPPPLSGIPIGKIGRRAAEGMNELGWHWWPASHAIPSQAVGSRVPCQRRGTCMFGCPEGAKSSTDVSLWPAALEHGARLITGARVREIAVDERGVATGAVYVDRKGEERFQAASVVILAANGIGTPRLLFLSASSRFPDGLANSSGLVGKRLMLHPYMSVLGLYDEDLESWVGPWGTPLLSLQFADTDESRGFPCGAQWDVMPIGGPLMALARYDDRPFAERWGPNIHRLVERTLGRAFDWGIGLEDLPSESNGVTLDPALRDPDGIPAPRIDYRIDEHARANLAFQIERAKEAHEAAGAVETLVTDWSRWGWHLLGTCKMGDDPRTSVVNRWGQAHDVANLYIVDGSVFPTSGPQPPTATIAANAARCVYALIRGAGRQRVPA